MNWGILSLLAIILTVLGGVGAFFLFLVRRASRFGETLPAQQGPKLAPEALSEGSHPFANRPENPRGQLRIPALWRHRQACGHRSPKRSEASVNRP